MFFYLKKETFIFLKATELCQKLGLLFSRSAAGSCLGGPWGQAGCVSGAHAPQGHRACVAPAFPVSCSRSSHFCTQIPDRRAWGTEKYLLLCYFLSPPGENPTWLHHFPLACTHEHLVSTRKTFEGQRERGWAWGLLWVGRVTSWLSCSSPCLIPATESGDAWESLVSLLVAYACVFLAQNQKSYWSCFLFPSFLFIYFSS